MRRTLVGLSRITARGVMQQFGAIGLVQMRECVTRRCNLPERSDRSLADDDLRSTPWSLTIAAVFDRMPWHDGCVARAPTTPTADDARRIAENVFGERPASCVRFTTGLRHWVYDVVLSDTGRNIVVRLSRPDHRRELAGGVFWHQQLEQIGVPVARVLASDVSAEQPYMILERLAGTDIGNVIDVMSADEIRTAAHAVVEMQLNTARLPLADGYGYALGYEDSLQTSWAKVLESSVEPRPAVDHRGWCGRP